MVAAVVMAVVVLAVVVAKIVAVVVMVAVVVAVVVCIMYVMLKNPPAVCVASPTTYVTLSFHTRSSFSAPAQRSAASSLKRLTSVKTISLK